MPPPPHAAHTALTLCDVARRLYPEQFRGDVPKGVAEIFFRAVKFWKGDPPPVFNIDGVNFLFTKKNGIYFMVTTKCAWLGPTGSGGSPLANARQH